MLSRVTGAAQSAVTCPGNGTRTTRMTRRTRIKACPRRPRSPRPSAFRFQLAVLFARYWSTPAGCSPNSLNAARKRQTVGRFICNSATVTRPLGVWPTISVRSSLHRKCCDQRWVRGLNSATSCPVSGSSTTGGRLCSGYKPDRPEPGYPALSDLPMTTVARARSRTPLANNGPATGSIRSSLVLAPRSGRARQERCRVCSYTRLSTRWTLARKRNKIIGCLVQPPVHLTHIGVQLGFFCRG